jgi:hypothetical protein
MIGRDGGGVKTGEKKGKESERPQRISPAVMVETPSP